MAAVVQELEQRLRELDPRMADKLENCVRQLLLLTRDSTDRKDALGYPLGYFERTAGSFAGDPLTRPESLPFEKREDW